MKVESADINGATTEKDVRYILVTMPEVNDDRYDVLKDGVKVCYEECKAQMEAANVKSKAKIAEFGIGESEDDLDRIKKGIDQLNDQWYGQRDKLYNEKLQEIEDAHNKWLAEKSEADQRQQEEEAARGDEVTYSMRMGQEEEV
jgi:ribosome recycling factor